MGTAIFFIYQTIGLSIIGPARLKNYRTIDYRIKKANYRTIDYRIKEKLSVAQLCPFVMYPTIHVLHVYTILANHQAGHFFLDN
jgi:hypothetical protein